MKEYIKLTPQGISIGVLILVLISMFGIYFIGNQFSELLINNFIPYSIATILIGVGFTLPSLIYKNSDLSLLTQTSIHIIIGMGIFIPTAIYTGFIPTSYGLIPIITSIIIGFIFFILIWTGFYLYYKKEANKMTK